MRPPQGRTVNGPSMCPVGPLAVVGAVSLDTQSHCVGPAPAHPGPVAGGGLPGMPFQPGGHFGQAGWSGEPDVCRAASEAAIKGSGQRWRQASAMVVAGWLADGPFISQGWWGMGRPPWTRSSGRPTMLGCPGLETFRVRTGRVPCCWPLPRVQEGTQ